MIEFYFRLGINSRDIFKDLELQAIDERRIMKETYFKDIVNWSCLCTRCAPFVDPDNRIFCAHNISQSKNYIEVS